MLASHQRQHGQAAPAHITLITTRPQPAGHQSAQTRRRPRPVPLRIRVPAGDTGGLPPAA